MGPTRFGAIAAIACSVLFAVRPSREEEPGPVIVPGNATIPVALASLGDLARAQALALSPDATSVAAAFAAGKDGDASRVEARRAGADENASWIVDGRVLALRWSASGRVLLALTERIGRKGRRDAFLDAIDLDEPDRRPRRLVLPAAARGMDVRREDGILIVASDGDLRTFDSDTLRSGRIFALVGRNLAVAFVPGGSKILVGRADGIVRVDLSAPQGRDGMPAETQAGTGAPVVEIAVSPRADRVLARVEGGSIYEGTVDPLSVAPTGRNAAAIAWPGTAPPSPIETPPAPVPDPPPVPLAPPPPPEPSREALEPPPPPIPSPAAELPAGQVVGRLTGAGRAEAVAVRLLGPDNVLKEARRVLVGADGTWSVDAVEPGSYRVVADGGGGRVLQCEPPFRTIRVDAGARVEVGDIEVRSVVR